MALAKKNKNFFPAMNKAYLDITSGIIEMGQKQGHFGIRGDTRGITLAARNLSLGVMYDWCCDNGKFNLTDALKRELTLLLQVRDDLVEF
jgi:hypothetical protein